MCRECHSEPPTTYDRTMDRQSFLKIGGASATVALIIGTLGPASAFARTQAQGPGPSLMEEFEEAAEEFGVPAGLLVAMGYVNTRWEMPAAGVSEYEEGDLHGWGGYGIMALVQNPSTDTLGEASKLTGIPEDELKTDRRSNIRGGAALLAESRKATGKDVLQGQEARQSLEKAGLDADQLGEWVEAASGKGSFMTLGSRNGVPAAAGVGGGEVYAEQVSAVLRKGVSEKTPGGEQITLQAQEISDRALERAGVR